MTLKEYRKKKGLTLTEMAALLGLGSPTSVFYYESGKQMPRKNVMERIEAVTGGKVKARDFYYGS